MAMPTYTMRQLLEAGVHFGHTTRRWNPKMAPIFLASVMAFTSLTWNKRFQCCNKACKLCAMLRLAVAYFVGWHEASSPRHNCPVLRNEVANIMSTIVGLVVR